MDIQELEDMIKYWDYEHHFDNNIIHINNNKLNKYKRKRITQKKIKKINNILWWASSFEKEGYYKRYYYSGRKKYAKHCSNKIIRHTSDFPLKGGGYKKAFDYWWNIF